MNTNKILNINKKKNTEYVYVKVPLEIFAFSKYLTELLLPYILILFNVYLLH